MSNFKCQISNVKWKSIGNWKLDIGTYLKFEGGQVLLIILLVMTVGLAIGLSVIQRSLTDVSTAGKLEQSSRALSAAEAGIENALSGTGTGPVTFTENSSNATVTDSGLLPAPNFPLEYPPLTREEIAQFWLANPDPALSLPEYYDQSSLVVYWGTPGLSDSDKPAIEFSITYSESGTYKKTQYFFDPVATRRANNRFRDPAEFAGYGCNGNYTIAGSGTTFLCRALLNNLPTGVNFALILARARFLYSTTAQPLLLAPQGGGSLPPQARVYTSVGTAGDTQRRVQLFKMDQVVPNYFDYAIFSAGDIAK